MEAQACELADGQRVQATRKPNRGSFQPGDSRINRTGRPRDAELAARRARAGQPLSGRLMTSNLPLDDLHLALTRFKHPIFMNLPTDYCLVAIALEQQAVILTIHSKGFAMVEAGQPTPQFEARYNGLMYRRKRLTG